MTAFTKFTASVAGLAAACTFSLATPVFAGPHGGPGAPRIRRPRRSSPGASAPSGSSAAPPPPFLAQQ